jgi:hypothetical protein
MTLRLSVCSLLSRLYELCPGTGYPMRGCVNSVCIAVAANLRMADVINFIKILTPFSTVSPSGIRTLQYHSRNFPPKNQLIFAMGGVRVSTYNHVGRKPLKTII